VCNVSLSRTDPPIRRTRAPPTRMCHTELRTCVSLPLSLTTPSTTTTTAPVTLGEPHAPPLGGHGGRGGRQGLDDVLVHLHLLLVGAGGVREGHVALAEAGPLHTGPVRAHDQLAGGCKGQRRRSMWGSVSDRGAGGGGSHGRVQRGVVTRRPNGISLPITPWCTKDM
jgi:hypothetical protein